MVISNVTGTGKIDALKLLMRSLEIEKLGEEASDDVI